jgi:hypothetical protein
LVPREGTKISVSKPADTSTTFLSNFLNSTGHSLHLILQLLLSPQWQTDFLGVRPRCK